MEYKMKVACVLIIMLGLLYLATVFMEGDDDK